MGAPVVTRCSHITKTFSDLSTSPRYVNWEDRIMHDIIETIVAGIILLFIAKWYF